LGRVAGQGVGGEVFYLQFPFVIQAEHHTAHFPRIGIGPHAQVSRQLGQIQHIAFLQGLNLPIGGGINERKANHSGIDHLKMKGDG